MYRKRFVSILFVIALVLITGSAIQKAQAHEEEASGTIDGVMHVYPNDNAVAGRDSGLAFAINDSTHRFDAANCDCNVQIKVNEDKLVYSQSVFTNGQTPKLNQVALHYTFPTAENYDIVLTGTPKQAGQFDPFIIGFDLQVTKAPQNSNVWVWLVVCGAVTAGVIITGVFIGKKHTKTASKK